MASFYHRVVRPWLIKALQCLYLDALFSTVLQCGQLEVAWADTLV